MRGAWCRAGDRPSKAAVDRAVQMPAQDAFDLRMARDDFAQGDCVGQPEPVHEINPGCERRVVHQQESRPLVRRDQRCFEPAEALAAQHTAIVAWQ